MAVSQVGLLWEDFVLRQVELSVRSSGPIDRFHLRKQFVFRL